MLAVEPCLTVTPQGPQQRRTLFEKSQTYTIIIAIDFYTLKTPELRTPHYKGQHSLASQGQLLSGLEGFH